MGTKEIIANQNTITIERMRHPAEILARYQQDCQQYKTLKTSKGNVREQLLMLYAEVKLLGWILGKTEADVVKDVTI